MAEKQSNKDRMREIVASIEVGIKELFESDKYRRYLSTMSRFHRYSLNNIMLIHMQRPDATHVAGYNKWRDQFGRHVKKGEKGIQIIAPTPYKKKVEEIKLDPDTRVPLLDKDGNAILEEKEISVPMFKVVSVFDVSQTDGKPLPVLASDLHGNVGQFEAFMEALRRTSPVPMEVKPIKDDMDGFFSFSTQSITIRDGMSQVQTVSAAVHEIAHALLHNPKNAPELDAEGNVVEKDRHTEEVEAESISYAVCQYYGIETSENSFGYIATWSQGRELPELRASLETINKTASALITDIDRHFAEICKERGITMQAQEQPEIIAQQEATANPKNDGTLFLVNDAVYIHIQSDGDGHSYTAYLKEGIQQFDDGVIDLPHQSDREALLDATAMMGLAPNTVQKVSLDALTQDMAHERLYILDDKTYLHIQRSEADTWDFSLYDKQSLKLMDGGLLDNPELSIDQARDAILAELAMDGSIIASAPADQLQDVLSAIQDVAQAEAERTAAALTASGQIDAPTDDRLITGVKIQPDISSDPQPQEQVLPDPTITVPFMQDYGYRGEDMLPLSKDRAMELLDQGLTVYMLHNDNTEGMVFDSQDIVEHDGLFGITQDEWDAVKAHIPARDVEKRFLESPTDAFAIYQLARNAPETLRLCPYDQLTMPPDRVHYEAVYTRELYPGDDVQTNLENINHIFSEDQPLDFTGHSTTVGDIIALKREGVVSYHYCDWIGFKELPNFQQPDNYLKSAEMALEDDYGMIDGIINNGPKATVAELEQQARSGQPISLMDLADAIHREQGEKKKSVIEQLKSRPTQEKPQKAARKKSAEMEI